MRFVKIKVERKKFLCLLSFAVDPLSVFCFFLFFIQARRLFSLSLPPRPLFALPFPGGVLSRTFWQALRGQSGNQWAVCTERKSALVKKQRARGAIDQRSRSSSFS